MIQDDWLHRQIEAVAKAVAALLGRAREEPEEARRELATLSRGLIGLEPAMVPMLSADQIRVTLVDRDKIAALALILRADAQVRRQQDPVAAEQERLAAELS